MANLERLQSPEKTKAHRLAKRHQTSDNDTSGGESECEEFGNIAICVDESDDDFVSTFAAVSRNTTMPKSIAPKVLEPRGDVVSLYSKAPTTSSATRRITS